MGPARSSAREPNRSNNASEAHCGACNCLEGRLSVLGYAKVRRERQGQVATVRRSVEWFRQPSGRRN